MKSRLIRSCGALFFKVRPDFLDERRGFLRDRKAVLLLQSPHAREQLADYPPGTGRTLLRERIHEPLRERDCFRASGQTAHLRGLCELGALGKFRWRRQSFEFGKFREDRRLFAARERRPQRLQPQLEQLVFQPHQFRPRIRILRIQSHDGTHDLDRASVIARTHRRAVVAVKRMIRPNAFRVQPIQRLHRARVETHRRGQAVLRAECHPPRSLGKAQQAEQIQQHRLRLGELERLIFAAFLDHRGARFEARVRFVPEPRVFHRETFRGRASAARSERVTDLLDEFRYLPHRVGQRLISISISGISTPPASTESR